MSPTDDDFIRELRATFRVEASEHLQAIATGLLALEKASDAAAQQPLIESVFRAAHSLKGAARAVDFTEIETLCQSLENLFASWKRRESAPSPSTLDAAHLTLDRMNAATGHSASAASAAPQSAGERASAMGPGIATAPAHESDTVRVSVRSLDERLLEAEELLAAKFAARQRSADLAQLADGFGEWRKHWARVQPEARALQRALDRPGAKPGDFAGLAEFVAWNHDWLRALESRVDTLRRAAEQDQLHVDKLIDDLLENSKKLLMLPLATLGALLPKVVRDLARELGKDAELLIRGDEVQIDKRILEEIKDPLVHLLRNSLDHGIETRATRRAAGKPERATITLAVTPVNGNQVEIAVSDDGGGVDTGAVRAQAVKRGLLGSAAVAALDDAAVHALVFETDLSTSPMITQVSGRGLGLAIVREKAEKLGGRVAIESRRGEGTTIRMTLPLALATFRGVLVQSAQRTFVVPTAQVERVKRFTAADVETVEGRETLAHNGRALALTSLAQVLRLPAAAARAAGPSAALILGVGNERIAFAVDAVIDEREVLVKHLAKPLTRIRNIAGATVLGSGEVAPILNVTDLLKSARKVGPALRAVPATPAAPATKRVLVAEDSITSRMLLKGILESAGYEVRTAVDGIEAFTLLRSEAFDVLVSDVEMPRLNGFDLTARVRADSALAELPIVLVTALASRDDRERGIEVGASAYLVKSNLDQSNLLEVLRRLA